MYRRSCLASPCQISQKYIKSWLNLLRSFTLAAIYHPDVLCLPFLPHIREQAKLSMVSTLELSIDSQIRECLCLLKDPKFTNRKDIPSSVCSTLEATNASLKATFNQKLEHATKQLLRKCHTDYWESTLSPVKI